MKKTVSAPVRIADIPPFGLRLQPDLKKKLEDAAKASGRSLNAEIAARLEGTFGSDDPVKAQVEDHAKVLNLHDAILSDINEMAWDLVRRMERVEKRCGIDVEPVKRGKPKG